MSVVGTVLPDVPNKAVLIDRLGHECEAVSQQLATLAQLDPTELPGWQNEPQLRTKIREDIALAYGNDMLLELMTECAQDEFRAMLLLDAHARTNEPLSVEAILGWHHIAFGRNPNTPRAGLIRDHEIVVAIDGNHHAIYVRPSDIEDLLPNVLALFSAPSRQVASFGEDPPAPKSTEAQDAELLLRFGLGYGYWTLVHPFSDGNGRFARWLTQHAMIRAGFLPAIGFPLDAFVTRNVDRHHGAIIRLSNERNTEGWVQFLTMFLSMVGETITIAQTNFTNG